MRRGPLSTVVDLRRLAERSSLKALAEAVARLESARQALSGPPPPAPLGSLDLGSFLEQRARLHLAWAVRGAQLTQMDEASEAEKEARAAWSAAAADLRAAQRLTARRAAKARLAELRRGQRHLDEAALGQWRRGCHG